MNNTFINTFGERLEFLMKSKGFDVTRKGASVALAREMLNSGCLDFYVNEKRKSIDSARSRIDVHRKKDSAECIEGKWLKAYCDYFKCSADFLFGYINFPTHIDTDIHSETGLSLNAIERLKSFTTYKEGECRLAIINYLLQDINFSAALTDNINDYYSKYDFFQNSLKTYISENKNIHKDIIKQLELKKDGNIKNTVNRHTLADRGAAADAARFRIQKDFDDILKSLVEYFYKKNNGEAPRSN